MTNDTTECAAREGPSRPKWRRRRCRRCMRQHRRWRARRRRPASRRPRATADATWRPKHVSGRRVATVSCEAGEARAIDPRLDAVVDSLPIREVLYRCLDALDEHGLVLQAPPGAVRPPRCPLAMILSNPAWLPRTGKVIVLEPRRPAARAAATRMASILNEPVGKTVGYSVRFESKVSPRRAWRWSRGCSCVDCSETLPRRRVRDRL